MKRQLGAQLSLVIGRNLPDEEFVVAAMTAYYVAKELGYQDCGGKRERTPQ